MSVRAIPIVLADGSIDQWLGVHTDVEDQARVQEATRRAREAAEASTRAKSEFLANMSHEIRTPMNGILGMTELALDTELSHPQREYLGLVKSSAEALLTVINDILDFSKIEAGKLDLDPMPFRLRDCVEETLKTLALRAHTKGLEISGRIAPDVPDGLVGDAGRLRQVLVNLVGNAIKFTDRGEVAVSVECEAADVGVTLHLAVKDTGIGIPIAKREAIFEPFEQADGSTTRTHGGTGLGLAISARLVRLMGGRIWVDSEPGSGSTFHFTARLALQPGAPPSRSECDPETLRDLPALVVDDNRTNRRILEELLASWGARPTSVDGGPKALDAMRIAVDEGRPFRVVLLDGMMPGMDGNAVADRIAADPGLASVIVILLTSNDMDVGGPRQRSRRIAASLTKPIRQSELFEVLMSLLPAGSPREIVPTRAEAPAPSPTGRSYAILLAEDNVVNQRVVTIMLEKRGHRVTVAGDGRRAIEALDRDGFDLVLMDVQMPEMDGFEAVAAIRRGESDRGASRRLPVIALTAHAMLGDRERCLAGGFDAYVPKPIRPESLIAAMDELLAQAPCDPPAAVAVEAPAAFDREAAMECTGGDEALFDEVLRIFLDDCPRLLDEIDFAIEAGDCEGLQRSAHTIRGASGHFAATAVVSAAQRLEAAARSGRLGDARACRTALIAALDDFFRALGDLAPGVAPWHRSPVSTLEHQP